MKDIILLVKGKSHHVMSSKMYEDPKKYKDGLTQKEIVKKNGFRQATEAETMAYFKVAKIDEPIKEIKPKKEPKKVEELIIIESQIPGEGHE